MPRKPVDHESLPVMVPRSGKRLVAVTADRVQRLRQHLEDAVRDIGGAKGADGVASRLVPAPEGFRAVVARTACSLCGGHCCRNGGDDAFLDGRTIARFRQAGPPMTGEALIRRYVERVPVAAYEDSCIFHGRSGCTLDRSMRADVCNTYFCRGLGDFVRSRAAPEPTIVIAGDGDTMRVSPVLRPSDEPTRSPTAARRLTARRHGRNSLDEDGV